MVQKLMALVNAIKGNKKRIAFTISANTVSNESAPSTTASLPAFL